MEKSNNFVYHRNEWYWGRTIVIVRADGKGLVKVSINTYDTPDDPECWIESLQVAADIRKTGAGTELLKEAERIAKEEGMTEVNLCASLQKQWLIDWYTSKGYHVVDRDRHEATLFKEL